MTIFKNTDNNKSYAVEHIIMSNCVCGKCSTGYFAYPLYESDLTTIEIHPSQIGVKFIPISKT